MNEPVCKRCDVAMKMGIITAPNTPGPVYWQLDRNEQREQLDELKQRSRKELKNMIKQKDLAGLGLVSYSLQAWRCESCGSVEFFACDERSGPFG